MTAKKPSAIGAAIVALAGSPAHAEVTRVDIVKRIDIAGSSYEKLAGTVHFAIDPTRPRNQIVVDLDKASRNASRLVEFSSDLYVLRLKDPTRGNGAMLVEMSNRGSRSALRLFNGVPLGGVSRSAADRRWESSVRASASCESAGRFTPAGRGWHYASG